MSVPQPFFREPRLIWLPDRETLSGESALRFMVIMELQHPMPPGDPRPNSIYRIEGTVPANERFDPAKVREYVMRAYRSLCNSYERTHDFDGNRKPTPEVKP